MNYLILFVIVFLIILFLIGIISVGLSIITTKKSDASLTTTIREYELFKPKKK